MLESGYTRGVNPRLREVREERGVRGKQEKIPRRLQRALTRDSPLRLDNTGLAALSERKDSSKASYNMYNIPLLIHCLRRFLSAAFTSSGAPLPSDRGGSVTAYVHIYNIYIHVHAIYTIYIYINQLIYHVCILCTRSVFASMLPVTVSLCAPCTSRVCLCRVSVCERNSLYIDSNQIC